MELSSPDSFDTNFFNSTIFEICKFLVEALCLYLLKKWKKISGKKFKFIKQSLEQRDRWETKSRTPWA